MKILVYKSKYRDVYFDATMSELDAFLALFKYIDGLTYYGKNWMPFDEWLLVEKARSGDKRAAYNLLRTRRGYEYEDWNIEPVIEP
jgi:hypothetical protein